MSYKDAKNNAKMIENGKIKIIGEKGANLSLHYQ
jgi:hypothetical protein